MARRYPVYGLPLIAAWTLACTSTPRTAPAMPEPPPIQDERNPSQAPPRGLSVADVPQFVAFGWDDNGYSGLPESGAGGGVTWAVDMAAARSNPDRSPLHMTFFVSSHYATGEGPEAAELVRRAWQQASDGGHEIGNHTHAHARGGEFGLAQWEHEIDLCAGHLRELLKLPAQPLRGFRTPFLEYNRHTFTAAQHAGYAYDTSIEEGYEPDQDGRNFYWPYTLHQGSPGHRTLQGWDLKEPIDTYPGLWELPAYVVIVPPDERCAEYGLEPGLRDRLKRRVEYFDVATGKITGFDYNLWELFQLSGAEFAAVLKHTLDLRLEGNRAPLLFGGHTDMYSDRYPALRGSTARERREAVEVFVDYALSKSPVRVRSFRQVLSWLR